MSWPSPLAERFHWSHVGNERALLCGTKMGFAVSAQGLSGIKASKMEEVSGLLAKQGNAF